MLNDWLPFETEHSLAQIDGILKLCANSNRNILDIGCGDGRTLVPLAQNGHTLIGIDYDHNAITQCRNNLKNANATATAILIQSDFNDDTGVDASSQDMVLALGNLLMTITDMEELTEFFKNAANCLKQNGIFLIDDFTNEYLPEIECGNWQSGLNEDGTMQLIFQEEDCIFTLREDYEIDEESWEIKPTDRVCRLWTIPQLARAASEAGLSPPEHIEESHLVIFRMK